MLEDGDVSFWKFNREVDATRVTHIADAIESSGDEWILGPAPIFIARGHGSGGLLLDGQHRVRALQRLAEDASRRSPGRVRVFLATINLEAPEDIFREFERINSGTPVPPSYWDARVAGVLAEFFGLLLEKFPGTASESGRPRRPRFNVAKSIDIMSANAPLRDAIRAHDLSATDILDAAVRLDRLEAWRHKDVSPVPVTCLRTAHSLKFHLGLDVNWASHVAQAAADMGRPDVDALDDLPADTTAADLPAAASAQKVTDDNSE